MPSSLSADTATQRGERRRSESVGEAQLSGALRTELRCSFGASRRSAWNNGRSFSAACRAAAPLLVGPWRALSGTSVTYQSWKTNARSTCASPRLAAV